MAKLVHSQEIHKLPERLKSLAIFLLMTGFRKATALALTPHDFYIDYCNNQCIIVLPPTLKCLPNGTAPSVRLFCTCKVDQKVCFLHQIKIPPLPITSSDLRQLCRELKTNPHAFRKTTATQLRVFNETGDGKVKVATDTIHQFFVWSKNSQMYKTRYSLGWELVVNHQFYSYGIIFNIMQQQYDNNHSRPLCDEFIPQEDTIIDWNLDSDIE